MKTRTILFVVVMALVVSGLAAVVMAASSRKASPPKPGVIEIKRDIGGIPHIYAKDVYGLYYGFGYALAEDRLFQQEISKRLFAGTLAAVLGPGPGSSWINSDKSQLSNINSDNVRAQYDALAQKDRDILDGSAAGYNARVKEVLANPQTLLPKQFTDFGFMPTEWTPLDVAKVVVGTRFLFGAGNAEIDNLALLTDLRVMYGDAIGWQIFDQLRWANDPLAPTTIPEGERGASARTRSGESHASLPPKKQLTKLKPISENAAEELRATMIAKYGGVGMDAIPTASNVWVVGPQKTVDGSTISVAGPMAGFRVPGHNFTVGLHGPGIDALGFTSAGFPGFQGGVTDKISFGATAGGGDTNDTYQEQLNPANQFEYFYQGSFRPMEKRTDIIHVKDGPSITHDTYSTVHGPVELWDLANNTAYTVKRSWAGKELGTWLARVDMMQARTFEEFVKANTQDSYSGSRFYADAKGNIGFYYAGSYPIRPDTQDFRLPAIGTGEMEWLGLQPTKKNPQVYNPAQGFLANWNNKPHINWSNADFNFWGQADHVDEITEKLKEKPKLDADELWQIIEHTSFVETNARYFLPFIQEAVRNLPVDSEIKKAARLLDGWDRLGVDPTHSGVYNSPAYTIFRTWLPIMISKTILDDIPAAHRGNFSGAGAGNPTMGAKITLNALQGPDAGVPQNYDFFNGADKYEVVRVALSDTVTQLKTRFGTDDMSKWLTPVTPHRFGTTNSFAIPQANADEALTLPVSMNRGTTNIRVIFPPQGKKKRGEGEMEICQVNPPGQSGFVAPDGTKTAHYQDDLEPFGDFGCTPRWIERKDVNRHLESSKILHYGR